jgi:hypothetical protein
LKKLIKAMKEKKGNSKSESLGKASKLKREIAFSKRKTRKIASYLVFGVMAVSLLFNVIHFSKVQTIRNTVQASYKEIEQQMQGIEKGSLIESPKLFVFSRDFVHDYMNVPAEEAEREERADLLKSYFVSGFDIGRLEDISDFIGTRQVKSVDLLDVKPTNQHEANVHYLVSYQITERVEVENEVVTKEEDEDGEKIEVTEIVTEEEEQLNDYNVEMIIPVVTDGEGFAVTRHPSLTSSDIKSVIKYEPSMLEGEDLSSHEREALEPFLRDFLTSFGQSDEKLAFMANVNRGLIDKVYEDHTVIAETRNDDMYHIRLHVTYRDEQTSLLSSYYYELTISEENGRLFVQTIQS